MAQANVVGPFKFQLFQKANMVGSSNTLWYKNILQANVVGSFKFQLFQKKCVFYE
jgi:hypothetical protein